MARFWQAIIFFGLILAHLSPDSEDSDVLCDEDATLPSNMNKVEVSNASLEIVYTTRWRESRQEIYPQVS